MNAEILVSDIKKVLPLIPLHDARKLVDWMNERLEKQQIELELLRKALDEKYDDEHPIMH